MRASLVCVDICASEPFSGATVGVVILTSPIGPFFQRCGRAIAAELNLPITAFIEPIDEHRYAIRQSSPITETPFSGSAALAASYALYEFGLVPDSESIRLDAPTASIMASRRDDRLVQIELPVGQIEELDNVERADLVSILDADERLISDCARIDDFFLARLARPEETPEMKLDRAKFTSSTCSKIILTARARRRPDETVLRSFSKEIPRFESHGSARAAAASAAFWFDRLGQSLSSARQLSGRNGFMLTEFDSTRRIARVSADGVIVWEGRLALDRALEMKL